jgi:ppGpp synthetase/RelA/SpoT-type nucleotidyltranferase
MARLCDEDLQFVCEHFPPPFNTDERFREYILPKIQKHNTLCSATMAEVEILLSPLKKQYHYRFFCRIDDTHTLKSPESIVDKLCRAYEEYNKEEPLRPGQVSVENFATTMTDLARFRIVCNFISDVKLVSATIEDHDKIKTLFEIRKKITIDQRPKERKSGERSIKFIMEYKKSPGLFIEIQIMTQLAEAWDKKDHYLIYEKKRREPNKDDENFPDFLDAKMFAMSELLYVADNYFDDLRKTHEDHKSYEESP